jgi:hypothetical protein
LLKKERILQAPIFFVGEIESVRRQNSGLGDETEIPQKPPTEIIIYFNKFNI